MCVPLTTKAQRKAEKADRAEHAEGEIAIYWSFCESSEKPRKTKGGWSLPLGLEPTSLRLQETLLQSVARQYGYSLGSYTPE